MQNLSKYAFLLITISFLVSCEEETNFKLPPKTEVGNNTLSCIINGEVFLSDNNILSAKISQESLILAASASRNKSQALGEINILINGNVLDQVNSIIKLNNSKDRIAIYKIPIDKIFLTEGGFYEGEILIKKLDTLNSIFSGEFWFNGISDDGSTVEVTNGQFDVELQP